MTSENILSQSITEKGEIISQSITEKGEITGDYMVDIKDFRW